MFRIGLAGGIGSGKSRVSELFAARGIPVFDCDSQAKSLMSGNYSIRESLIEATGIDFYCGEYIDKERLSAFIFSSPDNAASVNGVIHPMVLECFDKWCEELEQEGVQVCAVESAILFESGLRSHIDFVVVVDAPDRLRIKRAMMRDGAARDSIIRRKNAQMSRKKMLSQADAVIDNSGDEVNLNKETERVLEIIMSSVRQINNQ